MSSGCRFPYLFTARQWQELEQQALAFKYMVCGMPVPPDLLFTIHSSLFSSNLLFHQPPQSVGWVMGYGRKIDPEPGRCRRTDGKKWRCSKEACPDSKYCQRHMHRGRHRSRKPVEVAAPPPNATVSIKTPLTAQNNTTSSFFLESDSALRSPAPGKHRSRNLLGMRLTGESTEHAFFSSEANSKNDDTGGSSLSDSSWKLAPPALSTAGSSKHNNAAAGFPSGHKIQSPDLHNSCMMPLNHDYPKKVMHHFLDEWPPKEKDETSWHNSEDKMAIHGTQLSITIPNSLHDFFVTPKNEQIK